MYLVASTEHRIEANGTVHHNKNSRLLRGDPCDIRFGNVADEGSVVARQPHRNHFGFSLFVLPHYPSLGGLSYSNEVPFCVNAHGSEGTITHVTIRDKYALFRVPYER